MRGFRIGEALLKDSPARRQFGITAAIALLICGIFVYLYMAVKFLPDLGIQMMLGGGLLAVLVLLGPRVTLPLYFTTWFSWAFYVPGIPISINKVLAAAFIISWVVSLFRRPLKFRFSASALVLVLFCLYAVTMGIILRPTGAPPAYQQYFYLVMAFAVAGMYKDKREFLWLVGTLLVITCAISSVGLAEFIVGRDLFSQFSDYTSFPGATLRINGIAKNAIQYAFDSTWILPWALLLHIEAKSRWAKLFALFAIGYLVLLCLLTFNRQTPIIIGAMFVVGLPLIRYRFRGMLLVLMAIVAMAAAPLVIEKIVSRFAGLGDGARDLSFEIRRDKFIAATGMIRDNPWTGIGLDNFQYNWWNYTEPGKLFAIHFEKSFSHYVDMGYLQILTETGIVGATMFVFLIVAVFLLWRKHLMVAKRLDESFYRNAFAAVGMGFVQLLLSMLLQDTFFIPRTFLLFGLLYALVTMMPSKAVESAEHGLGAGDVVGSVDAD